MGPIWLHTMVYKKGEENRGCLRPRCWTSTPAVHVLQLLDVETPSCRLSPPRRPQTLLPSRIIPGPFLLHVLQKQGSLAVDEGKHPKHSHGQAASTCWCSQCPQDMWVRLGQNLCWPELWKHGGGWGGFG